jgi:hypothetical protein
MRTKRVTYYGRVFHGKDYTEYDVVKLGDYAPTPRGGKFAITKLIERYPDSWMYEVGCSEEFREMHEAFIATLW